MTTIKVALVDDDKAFCASMAALMDDSTGFSCVGAFPSGRSAVRDLASAKPDVVLMDIQMPQMSGVECLRQLKDQDLEAQIIMLTAHHSDRDIFESLMAGATGYLLKGASPAKILEAITEVHNGGSPMTSQIARRVFERFRKLGQSTLAINQLSFREEEVLTLASQGRRHKEIGDMLRITELTVRNHFQHIYRKLHVNSRAEAVAKFRHRGQ